MSKNFPNLVNEVNVHLQEVQQITNKYKQHHSWAHNKLPKNEDEVEILETETNDKLHTWGK